MEDLERLGTNIERRRLDVQHFAASESNSWADGETVGPFVLRPRSSLELAHACSIHRFIQNE